MKLVGIKATKINVALKQRFLIFSLFLNIEIIKRNLKKKLTQHFFPPPISSSNFHIIFLLYKFLSKFEGKVERLLYYGATNHLFFTNNRNCDLHSKFSMKYKFLEP